MSAEERPPTRDQLLAMAFADDELTPQARREFEARLAHEPLLAREVIELQQLEILARHAAGPEPIDHEWSRIARSPAQRFGLKLAWALVVIGGLGLCAWALFELCACELSLLPKLLALALVSGLAILLVLTLRARARTRPFDPYTEIKR